MPREVLLFLALAAALGTVPAPAQTLDEILAGNLETRGGGAAFDALRSARVSGEMTMFGETLPVILELKRPHKLRLAFELQGSWAVQAIDGERGWQLMPFFGNPQAALLPDDQLRQMRLDLDVVEGPLVRSAEKGYTVELAGKETIEGTEAFKLEITSEGGARFYSYLDSDHFLEFKRRGVAMIQGRELRFDVTLGNYKKVGDIYVPYLIETREQGRGEGQVLRIARVELDVELDDARFAMPAGKAEDREGGSR